MPHAEIKYSDDLAIDPYRILTRIEEVIQDHDPGAGACKGRAYPASVSHHSHIMIDISLLYKPHRNRAFRTKLLDALEVAIKREIPTLCAFSLGLRFNEEFYVTNTHFGVGR